MNKLILQMRVIIALMVITLVSFTGYGQTGQTSILTATNEISTANTYQFDITLTNTGTGTLEIANLGCMLNFNSAIINGGALSISVLASDVPGWVTSMSTSPNLKVITGTSNYIQIPALPNPGFGSGYQVLTGLTKLMFRVKLTNTVNWPVDSKANFAWRTALPNPFTKLSQYLVPNGQANSSSFPPTYSNLLFNSKLNTLPLAFNVIGSGFYCTGSNGKAVSLNSSEIGVSYQLIKNNSAIGTPVIGTGNSITFGDQLSGTYHVSGIWLGTPNTQLMNDSAVITETIGLPGVAGAITGNTTICQGNLGETYNVPLITNAESYVWEYSGTGVTINGTTNNAIVIFSANATSGVLTVKAQNACGFGTTSTPLAIVLSNLPDAAGSITGSSTVSPGQTSVAYTVPVINGATTYTWIYSGIGATINGNTNAITIDFGANATPGFLTVQGSNPCGNGTVSTDFAINVNSIPGAAGTIIGTLAVCPGQNNVMYKVQEILGANTYLWEYTGTGVTIDSTLGDTAYINFSINATSGNLTVKGHNSFGYGTVSANFAITVNSFPVAAGVISGLDTVCKNTNNVIFTVPAIQYATTYIWTLPTGATGTSTTNSISVNFGATAVNGNIVVKGNNVCGEGATSSKAIVINTIPVGAGTISGLSPVCQGTNNLTYTVPQISGATSYIWTIPQGVIGSSTTNSIIVNISTTSVGGQITVKGTNACGNGTASAMSLTVNPLPATAGVISGLSTVCQGQSSVTYTVPSITNATSYIWTKPNGTVGSSTTNTLTLNYTTTATSGNITVKGNNTCGQGVISTLPIIVNPIPDSALLITGLTTVCKGTTGVVYKVAPILNATSYIWTLPAGVTGTSTSDSIIVDITSIAVSGNITVKGSNSCGIGTISSKAIVVNDVPGAAGVISGNANPCQGLSNYIYSVDSIPYATSYIWTLPNGATGTSLTKTISVNFGNTAVSGNITVLGTNSCGTGTISTKAIVISNLPGSAGVISGLATVCQSQTGVTYTVPLINDATSYNWTLPLGASFSGSSTTNTITVNYASYAVSGKIIVKGQNSCGFGDTSSIAITVNQVPVTAGTITGPATVCKGGSGYTYSIPVIANTTSYLWTLPTGFTLVGSGTGNSINVMVENTAVTGNITARGVNSCGNGNVSTKSVTVNTVPNAPNPIVGNDNVCLGDINQNYSVNSVSGATSYTWTLPSGATGTSTSNSILVNYTAITASGYIVVKANNLCGTGDSTFKMITLNTIPNAAGVITGNISVCQGATGVVYTVPSITGATSYIWTLPTGVTGTSTTNTITVDFANNAAAGTISVYGTSSCGDGTPSSLAFTTIALPGAAGTIISVKNDSVSINENNALYTVAAIANATTYIWAYSGSGATFTPASTTTTDSVRISFNSTATSGILTVKGHNSCGDGVVSANYPVYVSPVGINKFDNSLSYSIYPNPTKGVINVNINGINSKLELQITNLQGEVIRTEKLANNKQSYSIDIDLSTYAKGVYFVKIINNSFVKVEKVVLQ